MLKQDGFTILEVVVAFTILSIVTIVTVGIVTQNTMRVDKLNNYFVAMELAETAMAEVNSALLSVNDAGPLRYQGKASSGFIWNAEAQRYQAERGRGQAAVLPLWKVDLSVLKNKSPAAVIHLSTIVPGK